MRLCPIQSGLPTVSISGKMLADALDHSVASVPKTAGCFPVISGMRFKYDAEKDPGQRVDRSSITVGGCPIDMEKAYSVTTTDYMYGGGDGFDMLDHKRDDVGVVNCLETAPILPILLRNHFWAIEVVNNLVDKMLHKQDRMKELQRIAHTISERVRRVVAMHHLDDSLRDGSAPSSSLSGDDNSEEEEGGPSASSASSHDCPPESAPAAISGAGDDSAPKQVGDGKPRKLVFGYDIHHPEFCIQVAPVIDGRIEDTSRTSAHLFEETEEIKKTVSE